MFLESTVHLYICTLTWYIDDFPIQEAIEKQSFLPSKWNLEKGDVDEAFKGVDHVIEGEVNIGAQEHFYIETHGCLATPRDNEMDVHAPMQWPGHLQVGWKITAYMM